MYKILSDPDRRALYDESGEIDDESDAILNEDRDWDQYWRLLFKKITLKDIKKFEEEYKYSEEESADLKQAYIDGKGDMEFILDNVLCCTHEDEDRFSNQIKDWIEDGEVER